MKAPPKKVFISYSHKNAIQREWLETALAVMIQNNEIEIWSDAQILPGDKWEREIKSGLEKSDILLYLVSPFSLASPNCNKEFAILGENPNIRIIPIILEDCDFMQHPLAEFQALPTKNKRILPISRWEKQSEAWQNVIEGIRQVLDNTPSKSTKEESDIPTRKKSPSASMSAEHINRANFFLILGNYDAAIFFYTEALKLNPIAEDAYFNRGNAYGYKSEYKKVIADYDEVIKLNPDNTIAYSNRGFAKKMLKDYKGAKKDFQTALKLAEQEGNKSLVDFIQSLIDGLPADSNS